MPLEGRARFGIDWGAAFSSALLAEVPYCSRDWFEDPEWISEACQSDKSLARKSHSVRACGILDSRVTIGAAAKGRSSSAAISRVLRGTLGYVLGSGIYFATDGPSRDRPVPKPSLETPHWLSELLAGRWLVTSSLIQARLARHACPERGPLDLNAGFVASAAHKMRKSLEGFLIWLQDEVALELSEVFVLPLSIPR